MSLRAYDGLMTRHSFQYIQDEISKRMDRFREMSINRLAKSYADAIVSHADEKYSLTSYMVFHSLNENSISKEIGDIKMKDVTILSYLFQASKILSQAFYVNDFMGHLNLSLECVDDKILVYPSLMVQEHKELLLEFLEDWNCQNGSDPDEDVPEDEWKGRERDWYGFDEVRGYKCRITLFDPKHHWDNLNSHFRGDELLDKIFEFVPTDEKRKKGIAANMIIQQKLKLIEKEDRMSKAWNIMGELKEEGNSEIEDYVSDNEISLVKINKHYLNSKLLNNE